MNPARPTWRIALVCVTWLTLPQADLLSQRQGERGEAQSTREKIEDRLLEGELLEVSAGDLEKAMTVYRALIDLTGTPESVRARALLYLARCHRKLGQVDRAKELLDRLLENHAEERDVLRQARAFLRELRGETRNPEFDWLSELGKNPEIQARVFDLAMDMVDLDGEKGQTARRQLLALGTVAVPVLEKMVTTSRDARHRHHLALLLITLGKVEHWKVLLDPKSPLSTRLSGLFPRDGRKTSSSILLGGLRSHIRSIPTLPDAERARLLSVIRAIPRDDATEPYRQLLLLRAGTLTDLAEELPHLEVILLTPLLNDDLQSYLEERVKDDPAAARALAERLLSPECETPWTYYRLLGENAPEALGVEHYRRMLERVAESIEKERRHRSTPGSQAGRLDRSSESGPLIARLEEIRAFDVLEELASGTLAPNLVDYFWKTYVESGRPKDAPAGWAPILRRARPVEWKYRLSVMFDLNARNLVNYEFRLESGAKVLHLMAEANDGFVGEFADFLEQVDEEAPEFRGYGSRAIWPWLSSPWEPSPRYIAAMTGLLDGAPPFALLVALEALSLTTPLAEATVDRVEAIASSAEDDLVREVALYTLVRHFVAQPEAGARVARALMAEVLKRLEAGRDAAGSTALSNFVGFGSVTPRRSRSRSSRPTRTRGRLSYTEQPSWAVTEVGLTEPGVALGLYPHVLDLTTDENGRRFHAWFTEYSGVDRGEASTLLLEKAVRFESSERKEYALPYLRFDSVDEVHEEQLRSFLKLVATDRGIETGKRIAAIREGRDESLEWFDWPEYLRSDDALLDVLLESKMPPPRSGGSSSVFVLALMKFMEQQDAASQDRFWAAAVASPHERVRFYAYRLYPAERRDAVEVYGRGLKDGEETVRREVKRRIAQARSDDMVPLLLELLDDDEREWRLGAIAALERLALQESVEPLVKLLDDSDFEIRSKALEALKATRAVLEEKEEWQKLLEQIKNSK